MLEGSANSEQLKQAALNRLGYNTNRVSRTSNRPAKRLTPVYTRSGGSGFNMVNASGRPIVNNRAPVTTHPRVSPRVTRSRTMVR